jgi:hypothetical protein
VPPQSPVTVPLNISAVVTFSGGVQAPIVVRQAVVIPDATSGSFPLPVLAKSCVVVVVNASPTSGTPSVSGITLGGAAGNFFNASTGNSGAAGSIAAIWVNYNVPAGGTAIVVSGSNLTVTTDYGITLYEITGIITTNPVDQISAVATTGTANPTSGVTPETTIANEIQIGAFTCASAVTFPNSPPWTNSEYEIGGASGSGYQIVNAIGTAQYGPSGSSETNWAAAIVTLKGITGGGTAQIGPIGQRELWYPQVISVSATTAVNQAACKTYAGPDTSQPNFVWGTLSGSTGDSTANIAGPGLAAANLPGRVIHCNEYIFAVWSGGDAGAQGRLNIQGMKVINSGGPPGWQHARTRP